MLHEDSSNSVEYKFCQLATTGVVLPNLELHMYITSPRFYKQRVVLFNLKQKVTLSMLFIIMFLNIHINVL